MILHSFVCPECSARVEDSDTRSIHKCPKCGAEMAWDLTGANIALDGDYNFESQSMAINPSQIEEHRALFPDVDVTPDGCPTFNSVKSREKYMDTCGFHKPMSKIH